MSNVIIAGGGTAGHTNPGIAVAQSLVELGLSNDDIHFIGGQRGSEGKLVPEAGFTITTLPGRGIQRKLSLASLKAGFSLIKGTFKGVMKIRKLKPKVVLCLGGYASFPATFGALIWRVPIVVSEQNARSSAVNRFFGKYAAKCALPFPNTDLPKGALTGNPIRSSIEKPSTSERSKLRSSYQLKSNDVMIAIWSGSLGARSVNQTVLDLVQQWSDRTGIFIYHIIGKRDWLMFAEQIEQAKDFTLRYRAIEYENDMATILKMADLAICRAGASTVSEITSAGLPSILVPLPNAPRDHQNANTEELVSVGGCKVIKDSDLSVESLANQLDPLLVNPALIEKMGSQALSVARPNAASDVAKLLIQIGELRV